MISYTRIPKRKIGGRLAFLADFLRKFRHETRGAIAVEFALTVPIMLSALFAAIEFGRLGFTQAALQHAAEEATRFAIVRQGQVTQQEIEDFAATQLTGVFNREATVITAAAPIDPATGTSLLSVEVSYQHQFLLPFLPQEGIPLKGDSSGFIAFLPILPN